MLDVNLIKMIGVGGAACCGKDTFVAIASNILTKHGYLPKRLAFADILKEELNDMFSEFSFNLDAFTKDPSEKAKIRNLMVWWGCQRRNESPNGAYWVSMVEDYIQYEYKFASEDVLDKTVFLISDVRFENEAEWVNTVKSGWTIHLKKYKFVTGCGKVYDSYPNQEEAVNDPKVLNKANYPMEWQEVDDKPNILKNPYLNIKVTEALNACKFFSGELS